MFRVPKLQADICIFFFRSWNILELLLHARQRFLHLHSMARSRSRSRSEPRNRQERHVIHVQSEMAGVLIGKGGDTINTLCRDSGASINVSRDEAQGNERAVTIRGSKEAIDKAVKGIEEIIDVWLKHMVCTDCGLFEGQPVCGSCRALRRIWHALRSGGLGQHQEERVVSILRGACGEIWDLVEDHNREGAGASKSKEGTPGSTSEPSKGDKPVKEEEESASESSGSSEEEEAEPDKGDKDEEADKEETPAAEETENNQEKPGEAPAEAKESKEEQEEERGTEQQKEELEEPPKKAKESKKKKKKESDRRRSEREEKKKERRRERPAPDQNPDLGLATLPRQLTRRDGRRDDDWVGRRPASPEGEPPRGGSGARGSGSDYGRGYWDTWEENYNKAPIQRRPKQKKDKPKGSKGQKRRDRGREFREWRESKQEEKRRREGHR
eukprot:s2515_g11.t1